MEKEDTTIELQEREQQRLCDIGFHFTVKRKIRNHAKGIRRFFKKATTDEETLTFRVYQPTLSTLDRMAPYMLRFEHYEQMVKETPDDKLLDFSKSTVVEAHNMAKIIAVMVLGEDYFIFENGRYRADEKELAELETIMYTHITPSKLFNLCEACLSVCNLADFTNSIRLMAAETESVATKPRQSRIE
jgi:hypothetical protein